MQDRATWGHWMPAGEWDRDLHPPPRPTTHPRLTLRAPSSAALLVLDTVTAAVWACLFFV